MRVALIGANGTVGPSILKALLAIPDFHVSVLSRQSSKSTYPASVHVLPVDDALSPSSLVSALTGQDALVIAFAGRYADEAIRLADAAFAAGVKYIIPPDFGSCDSSDQRSLDLLPLFRAKKVVRDHIVKLSQQSRSDHGHEKLVWTSLTTGHFFDYGLQVGLLAIDVKNGTARLYDGGEDVWAATTLETVGTATARALQKIDHPRLRNRLVYVQSVATSQNELIPMVEEVTGQKLRVERADAQTFIAEQKAILERKPNDHDAREELVGVEGILNTDWRRKGDTFVNDLLELPDEDLRALVERALAKQ